LSDFDPFHFPSELIELLTSAIPLLSKSKRGVLTFFRSCGVPEGMLADLSERVASSSTSISKYEIARTVLIRINDGGDRLLRTRRELIKQVTEFDDFGLCWPDDQLKAKGLVGDIRKYVNVKDSFTRMQQAEESHRLKEVRQRRQAAEAKQRRSDELAALRARLVGIASIANAQQRGLALELTLNDLFKIDGLSVREAFTLRGEDGRVQEQIDGLIALDGRPILVEAKWLSTPIGQAEISRHLVRVYGRAEVAGLFVSSSPYTEPAIAECKIALSQRVIVLAELNEIVMLLEDTEANLGEWLRAKVMAASVERKPLFYPAARPRSA
jgi:restriction system protein